MGRHVLAAVVLAFFAVTASAVESRLEEVTGIPAKRTRFAVYPGLAIFSPGRLELSSSGGVARDETGFAGFAMVQVGARFLAGEWGPWLLHLNANGGYGNRRAQVDLAGRKVNGTSRQRWHYIQTTVDAQLSYEIGSTFVRPSFVFGGGVHNFLPSGDPALEQRSVIFPGIHTGLSLQLGATDATGPGGFAFTVLYHSSIASQQRLRGLSFELAFLFGI